MATLLTNGNSKLGPGIYNFNMPAVISCGKYATKECKKFCYANKGNFKFEAIRACHQDNYSASKKKSFVSELSNQIKKLGSKIKYIRIHGAGEFYSSGYFNKWVEIAKLFPNITLVAYTKNYDINCSNLPDNFIVRQTVSTNPDNLTITGKAYVIDNTKENKSLKHMTKFVDTEKNITGYVCNSECNKCKFCYTKSARNKNVIFIRH